MFNHASPDAVFKEPRGATRILSTLEAPAVKPTDVDANANPAGMHVIYKPYPQGHHGRIFGASRANFWDVNRVYVILRLRLLLLSEGGKTGSLPRLAAHAMFQLFMLIRDHILGTSRRYHVSSIALNKVSALRMRCQ
jgi:hypothetical protein